jgi:peptide/nickel transport system substrate-binding protein
MSEHEIRGLLDEVRAGRLSRREFVRSMVAFGLSVPVASQLLAGEGLAQTSPRPGSTPTKRGGGGALRALSWDAPSLLNPILVPWPQGLEACASFYEPLVYFDPAGNRAVLPRRQVPSLQKRRDGERTERQ